MDVVACTITLAVAALAQWHRLVGRDHIQPSVGRVPTQTSAPRVLRIGDTLARAAEVLGPPHYSQYVGCNIMNADFWYLPDGSVLCADTEELDDHIRCLILVPNDGTQGKRLESWARPVAQLEAAPWASSVRIVAPAIHQQLERANHLLWLAQQDENS